MLWYNIHSEDAYDDEYDEELILICKFVFLSNDKIMFRVICNVLVRSTRYFLGSI